LAEVREDSGLIEIEIEIVILIVIVIVIVQIFDEGDMDVTQRPV